MSFGIGVLPGGAPDPAMPVPDSLQVVEALHQPTTFSLHYEFSGQDNDFPLLSDVHFEPEKELTVLLTVDQVPDVLVAGPVTRHEIEIPNGGSGATLDVVGADRTVVMDREDKAKIWNGVTDSVAVSTILGGYQLVPDVTPTTTVHTDLKHCLVQRETDLRFVRRLARRNGFWFWISSPAPGTNVAHFKRFTPAGTPGVEFAINAKASTVDAVSIAWDTERPAAAMLKQINLTDKSTLDGSVARSPLTGIASKGLADIVKATRSARLTVPADDAGDLTARAEALLIDDGWFVRARLTARLTVLKKVVHAHTLASLSGVGARHSGQYVVSRVVHDIDPDDDVMTIDLIRNGWN